MTKAQLIAWMAENLLASTFIGTGALLALLLATWPLRALWRLWRGRKVKQRPPLLPVTVDLSKPDTLMGCWFEFRGEPGSSYVCQEYDRERGVYTFVDPAAPKNIVTSIYSFVGFKMLLLGKPGGRKCDDHTVDANKMVPTVFADAKGYADSANAPDRVGREELDEVKARLAALEAKEALDCGPGYWGINTTSAGRSFGNFTASGFAKMSSNNNLEVLGPQDVTATPPASEPEVRVFSDDCFGPPIYALFSPQGKFWRGTHATWGDCVISGLLEEFAERATGGRTQCRELHGPEKDAIVAEWRAWRGAQ